MRDILFRGKLKGTNVWLYGDLICASDKERIAIVTQDDHTAEIEFDTVGQFTGLYDRNGKEIYEGDILRFSPSAKGIGYVCWNNELAQFVVILIADRNQWYCIYRESEIVGNIFDNPDLLKGE